MGQTVRPEVATPKATENVTTKVAIVTGAATGIGRAIVWQLHQDGFAVAINDISAEGAQALAAEIQQHAGRAIAVPGTSANQTLRATWSGAWWPSWARWT